MPAAKTAPPPKSIAMPVALGAIAVAALAAWAHVPAFPLLWLGLIFAGSMSQPPQLTGKGPGGVPEPVGAEIAEHLGDAYWTLGRRYEARYAWAAAALAAEAPDAVRLRAKVASGPTSANAPLATR